MRLFNKRVRKKHKLLLITPSGRDVVIGFLSPSRDGFVLGAPHVKGVDTSHLTIISKEGVLLSHITPQEHPQDRQYFPKLSLDGYVREIQKKAMQNLISPLSTKQSSDEVFYVTQRLVDWINSVMNTLYEKRISPRKVTHVINFKRLLEKLPQLIEEIKNSPSSFFGLCQANEILKDHSTIFGLTKSRKLLMPFENQLYYLDSSFITAFNPILEQQEISSPLTEIYRSMGILQYMHEVKKKKIIEKLLAKSF